MARLRMLQNCEFIAVDQEGNEKNVQLGASTYIEVDKVELMNTQDGIFANVFLKDGSTLEGVLWEVFENHGVPEIKIEEKELNEDDSEEVPSEDERPQEASTNRDAGTKAK